jgi:hypothetical protein
VGLKLPSGWQTQMVCLKATKKKEAAGELRKTASVR